MGEYGDVAQNITNIQQRLVLTERMHQEAIYWY